MSIMQPVPAIPHPDVQLEFGFPDSLTDPLRHLRDVWEQAKSVRTDMARAEDFDFALLREDADHLLVFEVMDQPLQLRVETAGCWITEAYGETLAGRSVESLSERAPLEEIWIQAMAAVRDRRPVYFRRETGSLPYERIVLPLWGESRVEKLVCAISPRD